MIKPSKTIPQLLLSRLVENTTFLIEGWYPEQKKHATARNATSMKQLPLVDVSAARAWRWISHSRSAFLTTHLHFLLPVTVTVPVNQQHN